MNSSSPTSPTKVVAVCPQCRNELTFEERMFVGEVLDCARCGAAIEVADPDPLVLERWSKIEEDVEDFH